MSTEPEGGLEELPLEVPPFTTLNNIGPDSVPNPSFQDGTVLPKQTRARFIQEGKPFALLKDIDQYYNNKQTYIVIGRWGTLHRFSSKRGGWLTLSPTSWLRQRAIRLMTHFLFSLFMIATLLLNSLALLIIQSYDIKIRLGGYKEPSWLEDGILYIVNYGCLVIYLVELGVKIVGRGLSGSKFSALHDPWTWLDILVIWNGYTGFSLLLKAESFNWIRLFKVIPLVPGIRQAGRLSLRAIGRFRGFPILLFCLLWGFAVFATQLYRGNMSQKCIASIPVPTPEVTDALWQQHNSNWTNWYFGDSFFRNDNYHLCGNASGAGSCPEGYVCLQGFGNNPDSGYTSFDTVFWAFLSVVRIATMDYTEEIYRQVVGANGPWHISLFVGIFFAITYPMGCLFFGILANLFKEYKAFDDEQNAQVNIEDQKTAVHTDHDSVEPPESTSEDDFGRIQKWAFSAISHHYARPVIICILVGDTVGTAAVYYGIQNNPWDYLIWLRIIPYTVFLFYMIELLLKLVATGPRAYFKNKWNQLDLLILLTFPLEALSYLVEYRGYTLAPFRMLKLIQYWPSLRLLFTIYFKTIKELWGWALYSLIIFTFIICIGPFELGQNEIGKRFVELEEHRRWSFVDFWHSFRVVFRMQQGEWIQTLWVALHYNGYRVFLYYIMAFLVGAKLIGMILVGVVHVTVKKLKVGKEKVTWMDSHFVRKLVSKLPTMTNHKEKEVRRKLGSLYHLALKIFACGLIVLSSIAMTFEDGEARENVSLKNGLLATEILFTVAFSIISIFELLLCGVKISLTSWSWLFDVVVILAPFRELVEQIKLIWGVVFAIFFVWLVFDSFAVHLLAGVYYRCIDEEGEDTSLLIQQEANCLANNFTWENSESNFDNSQDGFLYMVFLLSRMGWVSVMDAPVDSSKSPIPRQHEPNKLWIFYFISFLIFGGLVPLGILFSYIFNKFREDEGYNLILTHEQAEAYSKVKLKLSKEQPRILQPESCCYRYLFNFVTSPKFNIGVMALIILDMICISLDDYETRRIELFRMGLAIAGDIVMALYTVEIILKMACWGSVYFKDGWNYLDMVVVLSGILDLFLELPGLYSLRIFRLARIIPLLRNPSWGSNSVRALFSALGKVKPALSNLIFLHLTISWAYALLGSCPFGYISRHGCLDEIINFDTFQSSLWTLILFLGFPCLEGMYLGLKDGMGKAPAVLYLGSYAGLTFMFLLNIYAVLISETVWEMDRIRSESKHGDNNDVPLENLNTEERTASNGEVDAGEKSIDAEIQNDANQIREN